MQDLKVGIIQTRPFWEDKAANFSNYECLFSENFTGKTIDLILLPEMFNTGFSMDAAELAENMGGESIQWLTKQATLYNCQLAASLIIQENGKFFNRLVFVSASGVEGHYDKRHLFRMAGENEVFTAGEERIIHALNGWRILPQVCYDLRFPIFSRNHFVNGQKEYDLCIYLANWPEKRVYAWRNLLQARAIENQAYCIGVNRIGTDGNEIPYSGDSMLIDPWGIIEGDWEKYSENATILNLSAAKLQDIFEKFPTYLDAD